MPWQGCAKSSLPSPIMQSYPLHRAVIGICLHSEKRLRRRQDNCQWYEGRISQTPTCHVLVLQIRSTWHF